MSKFASNEMAVPDIRDCHKISKKVLEQYQEQVRILRGLHKAPLFEEMSTGMNQQDPPPISNQYDLIRRPVGYHARKIYL